MNTRRHLRPTIIATATLTAAVLSLTACTGDDGDTPEFTEQPRTTDAASASGTMSVDPSASESEDADAGQWLGAGDSVSVGWANAWPDSSTPWTFDEGYAYDVAVSNPRVFSETVAADPKAPADHPDSQEQPGQAYICVDLAGKNVQKYERAVRSTGDYTVVIEGTVEDHLTAAPADGDDVAEITGEFALMNTGPSATVGEITDGDGRDLSLALDVQRPVGTDSVEAYEAVDEGLNGGMKPEMVETGTDGSYAFSLCGRLDDPTTAPTGLIVNIANLPDDEPGTKTDSSFKSDTDARGWKLDL